MRVGTVFDDVREYSGHLSLQSLLAENVESVGVVPMVVLGLKFDSDSLLASLDLHELASLYPCPKDTSNPVEYFLPAFLQFSGTEARECRRENYLKSSQIDCRGVE